VADRLDFVDNPQVGGMSSYGRAPARRPPPRQPVRRRPPPPAAESETADGALRILRFDAVQRTAHWTNALLFGICILTALPLYFSQLSEVIGRHALVEEIHVWSGVALPVPTVVSLLGPWGKRMRRDVRRFNRWTPGEVRWLKTLGSDHRLSTDKFNPGQKLNALFIGGAIVVMLGTGSILKWFSPFPVSWRTGATFVHELLAWLIVFVVVGHILMAITHRESLRSIFGGWISAAWARTHASAWAAEELDGKSPTSRRPKETTKVARRLAAPPPASPSG
jgi:formate dehydrogenase subunit gamma